MNPDIVMVTIDCASPRDLAEFWARALNTAVSFDSDEFVMLAPNRAGGVRVGLQRVPEPRSGKNRAHVDLSTADRQAEVRRLVGLGATVLGEHSACGLTWTVLADPEGNEFCVGTDE
ncbi:VOC family protein [Saccharopolyspora hirsuta]|uniref:VOC family protein n=1 Tax=Saccharopolyspora hirsuta TaxID=1837 RepID=A0A5M7BMN8_SACHI|nr:VOC family protein [Saccharopolyspora hirsuta]KAA5831059.1 VOC family protein [Saccharopolyspora hirsuta]